jgi:WhiB family transcriptional regulator, redox-sensing transcriptional regulator
MPPGAGRKEPMHPATYARPGHRQPLRPAAVHQLPCSTDPELFSAESPDELRRARALCSACPIRAACLAGALQRGEPHGVWGGALFLRGAVAADKKPRARPRRSPSVARSEVMAGGQH